LTQKKTFGSKSLKIKVKDDKVTITFNALNWSALHAELLKTIELNAVFQEIPFADHVLDALKLKLKDISPSQESYERTMRLCEKIAVAEQSDQCSSVNTLDIDEPS